ncbi:MAG: tetratricopeptide repeat-containing sulfotransferase family protein [Magnetovibrionaceae bacterium]
MQARINIGLACLETGALEEAQAHLSKALKKAPKNLDVVNGLAVAQARSGAFADAIRLLNRALGAKGKDPRLLGNLISACRSTGDLDGALKACDRLLACFDPSRPDRTLFEAQLLRGQVLKDLGRLDEAAEALMDLSQNLPNAAMPWILLAGTRRQQGHMSLAFDAIDKALEIEPQNRIGALEKAETLRETGQSEAALAIFDQVLAAYPADEIAFEGKVVSLQNLGRFDDAKEVLTTFRTACPRSVFPFKLLAENQKFKAPPEELTVLRSMLTDEARSASDRSLAGFALGKILDDLGEYEEAMAAIMTANRFAMSDRPQFDPEKDDQRVREIIEAFENVQFQDEKAGSGWTPAAPRPVFIVGSPRSGTTLVESILAAHPEAQGLGELRLIASIAGKNYPGEFAKSVREGKITELHTRMREQYLDRIREGAKGCRIAIDKMPGNHFYLGLIRFLFPEAVVINCLREPRDVALSMLFQPFTVNHPASETLYFMGRRYRSLELLNQFWRSFLGDWFGEIAYSDLIEEPEAPARSLIERCGLDWDASVLSFHNRKSPIYSASKWQARQPIFKTSLARWRRYEAHFDAFEAGYRGEPEPRARSA